MYKGQFAAGVKASGLSMCMKARRCAGVNDRVCAFVDDSELNE